MKKTTKIRVSRGEMRRITGVERTFHPDEIIVSKTNLKGIITYANPVFCQIADCTPEQVVGTPHSVIRHPDMPHGIFKLLWETVEAGEEIFAYVVNRSFNGDHYWVLAHVTPSFDRNGKIIGYHSNRRVADSRVLNETIIPLYAKMREVEAAHDNPKAKAAAGLKYINDLLAEKGLRYDAFIFSLINPS